MPYTKIQIGNEVKFSVTPEKLPELKKNTAAAGCLYIIGGTAAGVLVCFILGLSNAILIGAVIGLIGGIILTSLYNSGTLFNSSPYKLKGIGPLLQKYRTNYEFSATEDSLILNSQIIKTSDLQRIIIKNEIIDYSNSMILSDLGNKYGTEGAQAVGGNHFKELYGPLSYFIAIETNGNKVIIGGGLNEAAANGISVDLRRIWNGSLTS